MVAHTLCRFEFTFTVIYDIAFRYIMAIHMKIYGSFSLTPKEVRFVVYADFTETSSLLIKPFRSDSHRQIYAFNLRFLRSVNGFRFFPWKKGDLFSIVLNWNCFSQKKKLNFLRCRRFIHVYISKCKIQSNHIQMFTH